MRPASTTRARLGGLLTGSLDVVGALSCLDRGAIGDGEDGRTGDGGNDRCHQDSDLGVDLSHLGVEDEPRDEQRHREPDSGERSDPHQLAPGRTGRKAPQAKSHDKSAEPDNADELAGNERDRHTDQHSTRLSDGIRR